MKELSAARKSLNRAVEGALSDGGIPGVVVDRLEEFKIVSGKKGEKDISGTIICAHGHQFHFLLEAPDTAAKWRDLTRNLSNIHFIAANINSNSGTQCIRCREELWFE